MKFYYFVFVFCSFFAKYSAAQDKDFFQPKPETAKSFNILYQINHAIFEENFSILDTLKLDTSDVKFLLNNGLYRSILSSVKQLHRPFYDKNKLELGLNSIDTSQGSLQPIKLQTYQKLYEYDQEFRIQLRKIDRERSSRYISAIDSLNKSILFEDLVNKNLMLSDTAIGLENFHKICLLFQHISYSLSDSDWKKLRNYLELLLEKGYLSNIKYAIIIDRYNEIKDLEIEFSGAVTKISSPRINANRKKIGLLPQP